MRVMMIAFLVLGVVAACGGEDGDENDPRRFEVSDAEWRKICPPPEVQPMDRVQHFRSDGTPICWEQAEAISEGCIRYFGGSGYVSIEADLECTGPEEQVVFCAYPDDIDPSLIHRTVECVSFSEAKRRSL